MEGKGIMYFNGGDRMMGDYLDDNPKGKHVVFEKDGNVHVENY